MSDPARPFLCAVVGLLLASCGPAPSLVKANSRALTAGDLAGRTVNVWLALQGEPDPDPSLPPASLRWVILTLNPDRTVDMMWARLDLTDSGPPPEIQVERRARSTLPSASAEEVRALIAPLLTLDLTESLVPIGCSTEPAMDSVAYARIWLGSSDSESGGFLLSNSCDSERGEEAGKRVRAAVNLLNKQIGTDALLFGSPPGEGG